MTGCSERSAKRLGFGGDHSMPSEPRDPTTLRALGEAVRAMREQAGLTGEDLAARAKISNSWLSRIEDGQVDPTWGTARMLAQGLGVTTEQLAELAEDFEKKGCQ